MEKLVFNGFNELSEQDCTDINGGFVLPFVGVKITGVAVAKFVAKKGLKFVAGLGFSHIWKRIYNQY